MFLKIRIRLNLKITNIRKETEISWSIIGQTARYGLIVLIYTVTETADLRFITARKADRWMVKRI